MSLKKVPALSLKDYLSEDKDKKESFAKDLYNSFQEYGFVVIKDHPISYDFLKQAYAVQKQYFELPLADKLKNDMNNSGQRGYTKFGAEQAKGVKVADLKEFYHIGREQFLPNTWPEKIPEFKPIMESLARQLDDVGDVLLKALGTQLGCSEDFLPSIVKDGASVMRLLHYPPVPEGIEPGQIRSAAHQDISFLTLLLAANGAGLQLLTKEGKWLDIESDPDMIVVNLGDMLEMMCNKNLLSTTHRVKNPDDGKNESRFSIPYFVHPRSEVMLDLAPRYSGEEPKMQVMTAGEYLIQRLKEIGLKK